MKHRLIFIMIVLWGCYALVGHPMPDVQDNKEERLVRADSIDQLIELIKSALQEKDTKRLEQIKNLNAQLVHGNLFLTMQECSTILKEAIESELSGQIEISNQYFQVSQILAEIYKNILNSMYLLDKVDIFRKWNKVDKKKYQEAEKLFRHGEKSKQTYKNEAAVEYYNKSLTLYQEIGYKEGEANCVQRFGDMYRILDKYEKARQRYEEGLVIFREIKNRSGEAYCVKGLGDVHTSLSEYEKAHQRYEEALVIFREIKNRSGEAYCIQALGYVNISLDEYVKARQRYEEALVIFREIKNRSGEAYCLKSLGDVHMSLSEYEKARQRYEEGLVLNREIKERLSEANCLFGLGEVHFRLYQHEKARQRYEEGLVIVREIKALSGEAYCLFNLGEVHMNLSEYKKARQRYEESLAICREIKYRIGEAYCLQRLGNLHLLLDDYEKARQRYEEGMVIFREIKNRTGEANILLLLGEVHRMFAEYEKARQRYEQGLAIYREINVNFGKTNALILLGDVHQMLGDYEKSRQSFEESLAICREIKYRIGEASCLQGLGGVHISLSEYEKARQRYEEGLLIFRELKDSHGEANCLKCLGDMYGMSSNHEKALGQYESALSIYKKIGIRQGMFESYFGLGANFESLKNYKESKKNYEKSILVVEDVWQKMKLEGYKARYFSSNVSPYEILIRLLFNLGSGSDAFHYAERSKARSFLYLLGNRRIDLKHGVPPNLAKEEEVLRQEINLINIKIMENEKREATRRVSTKKLNDQLLQLKQKHSEIMEKIKLNSPEYASMLTVNPLSVEEIQALIQEDKNTVLIEYYTTPDNIFMWLLDGKKIYPYKIDINRKTLDSKIQEFNSMISDISAGGNTIKRSAQRLYNLLLKPVGKFLNGKARIAIVPHGSLHYLPFEALMNKGKFLVEKNIKIFYLPSASVYKYCREKNKKSKEKITAFINPDGTLPGSEKEAEALKQLFPGRVEVFSGDKVTESMVKAN
ncbi:tetratricopeptide repeat protein, partial [Acidobacteriota bacterium]